jgi:RND family efflux transporter MFP subunit
MMLNFVSTKTNRLSLNTSIAYMTLAGLILLSTSCTSIGLGDARTVSSETEKKKEPVAVDVAIARKSQLQQPQEYTGTTLPYREISLRSRVEGQVLEIPFDVGNAVKFGQVLVRLDDALLKTALVEAEAELAALNAEVSSLQAEVENSRTQVEKARLELAQAKSNAERSEQLFKQGAISEQNAELARTTAKTAEQAWRSTQKQVKNRSLAVKASQRRIAAKQALVTEAKQRLAYTTLKASVDGSILSKQLEPGDLAQPGTEILKLGDLKQIKILVQISELELNKIKLWQNAKVKLDAFPNRSFTGKVTQISPTADPTARLIPIEIVIPNSNREISTGLLARVNFDLNEVEKVVISESAIEITSDNNAESSTATVFVVNGDRQNARVRAKKVVIGERKDERLEILSGLAEGDRFVVRSSGKLKDGDRVRLSIISEQ